jgi:hypothetical protein
MLQKAGILLAAVIGVAAIAVGLHGTVMGNDIAAEFRKERQRSRETTINVDHVAQAAFPIGTDATTAEETLKKNGFKIQYVRPPSQFLNARPASGPYQIMGSRFEQSMAPFQDEYRIGLTIENDRVVSVLGRIFWQSL